MKKEEWENGRFSTLLIPKSVSFTVYEATKRIDI